jgi:hypothetical protein
VIGVAVVVAVAAWLARRNRDLIMLVVGLGVLVIGFMGLRALH